MATDLAAREHAELIGRVLGASPDRVWTSDELARVCDCSKSEVDQALNIAYAHGWARPVVPDPHQRKAGWRRG